MELARPKLECSPSDLALAACHVDQHVTTVINTDRQISKEQSSVPHEAQMLNWSSFTMLFTCVYMQCKSRVHSVPQLLKHPAWARLGIHRRPLGNAGGRSSINQCRGFVSSHDWFGRASCKGSPSKDRSGETFEHDDVDDASIQLALLCVCPSLNLCSLQLLNRTDGPWNWFRVPNPAIQIQTAPTHQGFLPARPGLLNLAPNLPAVPSTHMQPQKAFATFSPTSFSLARFSEKWKGKGERFRGVVVSLSQFHCQPKQCNVLGRVEMRGTCR
jgi:hypothetical protein